MENVALMLLMLRSNEQLRTEMDGDTRERMSKICCTAEDYWILTIEWRRIKGATDWKIKVVDLYSASTRSVSKVLGYSTHCQSITQFHLYTLRFICKRNELYMSLTSQPQLVLIYQPWRDGRLSRPWCEIWWDSNLQPRDCKSGTIPHSH